MLKNYKQPCILWFSNLIKNGVIHLCILKLEKNTTWYLNFFLKLFENDFPALWWGDAKNHCQFSGLNVSRNSARTASASSRGYGARFPSVSLSFPIIVDAELIYSYRNFLLWIDCHTYFLMSYISTHY